MKNRKEIIQFLIDKFNYQSYLEIGLSNGKNINSIKCHMKIGVDPVLKEFKNKNFIAIEMTSDEYFENHIVKYDIIFIDGLHHADQVHRDIENSLKFLNECGTIVCHDMNPHREKMQIVPRIQSTWTGDCWKAWVKLRKERKDLTMFVVDTDYGCGIIQNGEQEILKTDLPITYENFASNKKEWLNLISVEEFKERINGTSTI